MSIKILEPKKVRKKPIVLRVTMIAVALCVFRPLQAEVEPGSLKPNQSGPAEPHWELFLDDHIIARSTGFRRVVHHPEPRGIVIPADQPWETQGVSPMYVGRRKEGSLECYYRVHGGDFPVEATAYAISQDGIHWDKPILGLVRGPEGKDNNLLPCGQPVDLALHGNVRDPAKRFVIPLGAEDGSGTRMRLFFGNEPPDFINDPDWRNKLVEAGVKPSYKLGLHFWDDQEDEWVCMRQSPNHPPTRAVARWATKDLQNWTLQPVLYPDAADSTDPRYFDEAYGMRAVHTEGRVLGFIEWFIGDQTRPEYSVYEQELIGPLYMKGPAEIRIAVSRDGGFTWDRTVSREAWIPHGTEEDSYDRCVRLYTAPVRMDDEDWFYCTAVDGDHAGGIGYYHGRKPRHQGALYVQKHNRYVSLRAGNTPQILITKPVQVTGKTLQFNVDADHGEIKVGIGVDKRMRIFETDALLPNYMVRDRQGETHLEAGFHLEDCEPINVNSIEHNVEWKDANLESLMGKTVRLYIMVQDANLYGLRFK